MEKKNLPPITFKEFSDCLSVVRDLCITKYEEIERTEHGVRRLHWINTFDEYESAFTVLRKKLDSIESDPQSYTRNGGKLYDAFMEIWQRLIEEIRRYEST